MSQTVAYAIRDSLYLNITDRCTLACRFCPKTLGVKQVHDFDLTLDHRPEIEEILAAVGDPRRYRQVVFCGFGEPTLRLKVLLEVTRRIKAAGGRVRINTDGLGSLANKRDILPELAEAGVDSLSVSLNAHTAEVYDRHCAPALAGSFEAVVAFLREAPRHIPEVTATAIEGLEGVDIAACEALAHSIGVQFRKRSLDVVG